ncbi:hypothetical protein FO488_08695 [Geobacter sp. FeAm09]|uniref:hypothetical protein n=1 Tax=Geobacter sp. FeAm09 TaxID=2597769 RepID=UPI0011EBBA52|nr:hypothetical protein [Geobacter sp. FeAm09]QEM68232.1 hypothetical protein FO488_08695 [Geobacter sp. FeAm09]
MQLEKIRKSALPCSSRNLYDFRVSGYHDDTVTVSVDLPEPLVIAFVSLLDSLTDSFRFLQYKAKTAKAEFKVIDPVEIDKSKKAQAAYEKTVLDRYDKFASNGLPPGRQSAQPRISLNPRRCI